MSFRTIALIGIAFATLQTAHAATSRALKHHGPHPQAVRAERTIARTSPARLGGRAPQARATAARPDLQAAAEMLPNRTR